MAVEPDLAFASIRTLGKKLRAGEFSSIELTEFFLERAERFGPRFNAVVTITRKLAIGQAERADRELAQGVDRGPLHGIPCGVKDLLATSGIPTSWGAAPLKEQVFDEDATVVKKLRDAGAVLIAKLAMVEMAGGLGYRQADASFTGPGLNPWNAESWSGGSSSGPGAAVGAGIVPFAIGSETWGSIMTPASYCGVSGLRPTYGRVSRHGAMALSWTMDKLGPMCRTAEDCALVLHAIAGADPEDSTSVDTEFQIPTDADLKKPFKLATLKGATAKIQPEVKENYLLALDVLGKFATFEEIELPDLPYSEVASTLIAAEMSAAYEGLLNSGAVWEMSAPEDRPGVHSVQFIPARDYINALRIRKHIQRAVHQTLAPFDAVVTPTLPAVAVPIAIDFGVYFAGYKSNDLGGAGNAAGIPAISVPSGFGERNLPTGLQFAARAWGETRMLAAAQAYQQATRWHEHHPLLTDDEKRDEKEKPSE